MASPTYINPPLELTQRTIIPQENARFTEIIDVLTIEFNKKTIMYYCSKFHSIETRNSASHPTHDGCKHFTKGDIIGTELLYASAFKSDYNKDNKEIAKDRRY